MREQIDAITPQPTFFGAGREESYNVLLLPFKKLGSPADEVEGYVKGRLRSISESGDLPLNINVREPGINWELGSELINALDARKIGEKFGADMVIWGEYFLSSSTGDEIKLGISSESPANRFTERKTARNSPEKARGPRFAYLWLSRLHKIH